MHRVILGRINAPNHGLSYVYRFNMDSPTQNHYKIRMCGPTVRGTCHADDLSYVFKNSFFPVPKEDTIEFTIIKKMVSLFTSFAITGNPNSSNEQPQWKPVESKQQPPFKCLNISNEITFIDLPETKRFLMWDSLYASQTNAPLY